MCMSSCKCIALLSGNDSDVSDVKNVHHCREVSGLGADLTTRQAEGVVKASMKQMYGIVGSNAAATFTVLDVRGIADSWHGTPASSIIVRLPRGCDWDEAR
jgi:hypothetical protein